MAYAAASATASAMPLRPPAVLPALLVIGGGVEMEVGLPVRLPVGLPEMPLAVIAVSAGAEQGVVGTAERVTIVSDGVVVGHVSHTTIEELVAATQV